MDVTIIGGRRIFDWMCRISKYDLSDESDNLVELCIYDRELSVGSELPQLCIDSIYSCKNMLHMQMLSLI